MISSWQAQAFNQVPDSDNQIHGDELAQAYGFTGGLVPGVTISAYLAHPAVTSWGLRWLDHGFAHVKVTSPLYDGESFEVRILEQTDTDYAAELVRPDGTVSATARVGLPELVPEAPLLRGDPVASDDYLGAAATVERFQTLRRNGCHAIRFEWGGEQPMQTYLRQPEQMPALLQAGEGGYANLSFVLGCSNWALDRNAYMNPWVHLETRSQNYRAIAAGTPVIAEMTVADLFEKRGHEFIDVEVALFDARDQLCLSSVALRAIYKLRGA